MIPNRFQSMIRNALVEYPDNEKLLNVLSDSYEYDYRTNGETAHLDEILAISQKLIDESGNFEIINNSIESKAVVLLAKGQYNEAKETLETLPSILKNDVMAFHLSGLDKYNAAAYAWCSHLQKLYSADLQQADAVFELDESVSIYQDYGLARFFYKRGAETIELYIKDYEVGESYVWAGMQTFHYIFYLGIARCCKKLGEHEECRKAVDTAYSIISASWEDFNERREYYLEPYNEKLKEYDLCEFIVKPS